MPLECCCCGEDGFDYHGIVVCDECRDDRSHIEEVAIHLAFHFCLGNPASILHFHPTYSNMEETIEDLMEDHGLRDLSNDVKESIEEIYSQWLDEHQQEYLVDG